MQTVRSVNLTFNEFSFYLDSLFNLIMSLQSRRFVYVD